MTPEIVILAMIAAFLGLRLYSVLGRRAEHEEEPIQGRFEGRQGRPGAPRLSAQPKPDSKNDAENDRRARADRQAPQREMPLAPPPAERGLAEIASADRRFDTFAFLEGAQGAYRMILEAFWKGDKAELEQLCDKDVHASFAAAIDARNAAGETLDNKLVRIEECTVVAAGVEGGFARITLRFRADIAAVTRNAAGEVIAGSLDDAIETVDVWTFTRALNSPDPDWLLDETDEG
ncbi:Predicted lipid-binding transport protein, Tim44 family [Novosphingobium sp. CF614]|uniref:Tim44/TimA family putative adaptor protein n=1 Tax=Novosphingobium sp. CF614 TaxID=1884364 RepID=UPI0008E9BA3C|nr:Tim44/TimA family putative adaptor protein [Novosphingobium sp. CF614]SFG11905.1 Predicted lipid-binding transport protein, Tim44 family [Novosphingobium sp. CF614]